MTAKGALRPSIHRVGIGKLLLCQKGLPQKPRHSHRQEHALLVSLRKEAAETPPTHWGVFASSLRLCAPSSCTKDGGPLMTELILSKICRPILEGTDVCRTTIRVILAMLRLL